MICADGAEDCACALVDNEEDVEGVSAVLGAIKYDRVEYYVLCIIMP